MKILSKAAIQKEREALKKRLADLDVAEHVLETMGITQPIMAEDGGPSDMPSIKKIILTEAARKPVSAAEIAAIIGAWIPDYPVKNVSPKLSLYGSQDLIVNKNGLWSITQEGLKELAKSNN